MGFSRFNDCMDAARAEVVQEVDLDHDGAQAVGLDRLERKCGHLGVARELEGRNRSEMEVGEVSWKRWALVF